MGHVFTTVYLPTWAIIALVTALGVLLARAAAVARRRSGWFLQLNRLQTVGYVMHGLGMYALMALFLLWVLGVEFDARLFAMIPVLLLLGIVILAVGSFSRVR